MIDIKDYPIYELMFEEVKKMTNPYYHAFRKIEGEPIFQDRIETYDRDGGVLVLYRPLIHKKGCVLCGEVKIIRNYETESHTDALSQFLAAYMPYGEWYSDCLVRCKPALIKWKRVSNTVARVTFELVELDQLSAMEEFSIGSTLYRVKF